MRLHFLLHRLIRRGGGRSEFERIKDARWGARAGPMTGSAEYGSDEAIQTPIPDYAPAPSRLRLFRPLKVCNRFQSRMWSPAVIGIYKKPGNLRFLAAIDL